MSPRPVIGITGSVGRGHGMWLCAALAVLVAGGLPVRITARRRRGLARVDGLILGGGDDIGLDLEHGGVDPEVRIDPERDALEMHALGHARRLDLPLLGICRGSQMINVVLGGTLHPDIFTEYPGMRRLRTIWPRKRVQIRPDTRLAALFAAHGCRVNAMHHQAVDRPGRGLRVVAKDGYGVVQGIEGTGGTFVVGVQWHPEFLLLSRRQHRLFRALVGAARRRAAERDRGRRPGGRPPAVAEPQRRVAAPEAA